MANTKNSWASTLVRRQHASFLGNDDQFERGRAFGQFYVHGQLDLGVDGW